MKNCTFIYPFYNNQSVADTQCRLWNSYSESIRKRLCIIVVDDGSTPPLTFTIDPPVTAIHLRVTEDIRWNQPGAKNLAMKFVPTEWTFISDADHLMSEETVTSLLEFMPKDGTFYTFGRSRNGQPWHPHPNTFLMRKSEFFSVGGYDEDFCGSYGYDDIFFVEKMKRNHQSVVLEDIRLENNTGFATPDADRNHRKNKHLLKKKKQLLKKNRYQSPRMIRFNWEIVHGYPPLPLQ